MEGPPNAWYPANFRRCWGGMSTKCKRCGNPFARPVAFGLGGHICPQCEQLEQQKARADDVRRAQEEQRRSEAKRQDHELAMEQLRADSEQLRDLRSEYSQLLRDASQRTEQHLGEIRAYADVLEDDTATELNRIKALKRLVSFVTDDEQAFKVRQAAANAVMDAGSDELFLQSCSPALFERMREAAETIGPAIRAAQQNHASEIQQLQAEAAQEEREERRRQSAAAVRKLLGSKLFRSTLVLSGVAMCCLYFKPDSGGDGASHSAQSGAGPVAPASTVAADTNPAPAQLPGVLSAPSADGMEIADYVAELRALDWGASPLQPDVATLTHLWQMAPEGAVEVSSETDVRWHVLAAQPGTDSGAVLVFGEGRAVELRDGGKRAVLTFRARYPGSEGRGSVLARVRRPLVSGTAAQLYARVWTRQDNLLLLTVDQHDSGTGEVTWSRRFLLGWSESFSQPIAVQVWTGDPRQAPAWAQNPAP